MKEDLKTQVEEPVNFFFENEDEEALGVKTAIYPNGNTVKSVKLSNGKEAIVRELTGKDIQKAEVMAGNKKENMLPSIMALATKIDGVELPMEVYPSMKAKDYNKIKYAASALNF